MQDIKNLIANELKAKGLTTFASAVKNSNDRRAWNLINLIFKRGLLCPSKDLELLLFKKLYISGFFCHTPTTSESFQYNWDYIKPDLEILARYVKDIKDLDTLDEDIKQLTYDLYLFEPPLGLKEALDWNEGGK